MQPDKKTDDEFFDCCSDADELSHLFQKKKTSESKRESIVKSISSHSSIRSSLKNINPQYIPSLPKVLNLKKHNKPDCEFSNLRLMQEITLFNSNSTKAWTLKFSQDSLHLSVTGQHIISIYDVQTSVCEIPILFKPTPKIFTYDSDEITCTSWAADNSIFSSSVNGLVAQWHIDEEKPIACFTHPGEVSAVECLPQNSEVFVTACVDLIIRVFSTRTGIIGYYQAVSAPSCLAFDETSKKMAVGTQKGEVMVYNSLPTGKFRLMHVLVCRNSKGIYSGGRRVTGIEIRGEYVLASTNDSRIRLFRHGVLVHKYKGHKNQRIMMPVSFSEDMKYILSGSQTGSVFIWNSMYDQEITIKLKQYENFQPRYKKSDEYAMFLSTKVMDIFRNIYRSQGAFLKNIIISAGAQGNLLIVAKFP